MTKVGQRRKAVPSRTNSDRGSSQIFGTVHRGTRRISRPGETPEEAGLVNQTGLSRKHIFDGVQNCLKRLQVDYIDVLQCHRFDYNTPIEETVRVFDFLSIYFACSECMTLDASPARCRESRIRSLHRHELVLCIPV